MAVNLSEICRINDLIFKHNRPNIVFVYTPPKVGSTTLVTSLRLQLINTHAIVHIHDDIMLHYLTGVDPQSTVTVNDIIRYNAVTLRKNVYVINVYRSPIERKISEYFEKLSPHHFNNSEANLLGYSMDTLMARFNAIFPHIERGDHYFDMYDIAPEMRLERFDHTAKMSLQLCNGVTYVLLRLIDSTEWGEKLSALFGKRLHMVTDYETARKDIGPLYLRFKNEYRIPPQHLALIAGDPHIRFYYSAAEYDQYMRYWSGRLVDTGNAANVVVYSAAEYAFYVRLCLENQQYGDVQRSGHYKDEGCICKACTGRRAEICRHLSRGDAVPTTLDVRHETEQVKKAETHRHAVETRVRQAAAEVRNRNQNRQQAAATRSTTGRLLTGRFRALT